MSVNKTILAFLPTEKLIELALDQAALTTALAERLEMVERDKKDLMEELNKPENDDDCNQD